MLFQRKSYNTFTYIVSAMSQYMSLPKYAKELNAIYKGKNVSPEKLPHAQVKFIKLETDQH